MKEIRLKQATLVPQLRRLLLFKYFGEQTLLRLLEGSAFVECGDDECFIHEHAIESQVYVILEGSCAVMVGEGASQSYIATLGAGEVVGEAAIFANHPRTANVVSKGPSRLMRFDRETFLAALREDPHAGMRVLFAIAHELLAKLREVNLELAFERRENSSQEDIDSLIDSLITRVDPD